MAKLKHLDHLEDMPLLRGASGFRKAFMVAHALHKYMSWRYGVRSNYVNVSTKFDGAPSVVFGVNPDNGKFFVATKSAWNKTPKLNYDAEDIVHNHGHSPELCMKLQHCLIWLPKTLRDKAVYQGDFLFHGATPTFQPNLIRYTAVTPIKHMKYKLGIAVHTRYEGKTFADLEPVYDDRQTRLYEDTDEVYFADVRAELLFYKYGTQAPLVREALKMMLAEYKQIEDPDAFTALDCSRYLNSMIKGEIENSDWFDPQQRRPTDFVRMMRIWCYLLLCKKVFMSAIENSQYSCSINGQPTGHEGWVAAPFGIPVKLVDRYDFTTKLFEQGRFQKR
jgi:hypothetical protein